MPKVILVILDGLEYSVAHDCMGYISGIIKEGLGKSYKIKSELPSLSRPLYECILTGINPINSGVTNNDYSLLSKNRSIFHYAKEAGLKTGAAAYHWVSELYNKSPFDKILHRHIQDINLTIPYGHFYYEDNYPDTHLFGDGESLRIKYDLDFLLFHSMNIDDIGHKFSLNSKEYRNQVRKTDNILSEYLQKWLNNKYNVIITSDHGINNDFSHGGTLECETNVPFFVFGDKFSFNECEVKQTQICGSICEILKINHDKTINMDLIKC